MSRCLSCHGASTDMQHDLPGLFINSARLNWRNVKLFIDIWGFKCVCCDASRCEECDGVLRFYLSSLVQKLFAESNGFTKKQHSLFDLSLKGPNVTKVVKAGMVESRASLTFCLSLLRSSIVIRRKWARGMEAPLCTPRCVLGFWNGRCRCTGIPGCQIAGELLISTGIPTANMKICLEAGQSLKTHILPH